MSIGSLNQILEGDCRELISRLDGESVDVVVTRPPYWGQRTSPGVGVEDDPRDYLLERIDIFRKILPKLKPEGIGWCNLGCAAHLFDRAKGLPGSRRKGTGLYIIPPEPRNL